MPATRLNLRLSSGGFISSDSLRRGTNSLAAKGSRCFVGLIQRGASFGKLKTSWPSLAPLS